MFFTLRNIASVLLALSCATQVVTAAQREPCVKIEFRRAERAPGKGLKEVTPRSAKEKVYLHNESVITNKDFLEARVVPSTLDSSGFDVEVTFTKQGAKKMADVTKDMIGKPLAIVIDTETISAPFIHSQILDRAVISGLLGMDEAQKIADAINGCGNQARAREQAAHAQAAHERSRIKSSDPIKVELREAEHVPGKGLKEAKVMDTDERTYLYPEPIITNSDIIEASAMKNRYGDNYSVALTLSSQGAQQMLTSSRARVGKPLAILIDGKVISVPIVISEISDRVEISGNFTRQEAEIIAQKLNRR